MQAARPRVLCRAEVSVPFVWEEEEWLPWCSATKLSIAFSFFFFL